jgi:hypothetical protein
MGQKSYFRTANSTAEQVVVAGRVRLHAVRPELTTTGTLTLRDSATAAAGTPVHVAAIGVTQAGKDFHGAVFNNGITLQQSVGTDQCLVVFERF